MIGWLSHPGRRILVADAGLVGLRTAAFAGVAAAGAAVLVATCVAPFVPGGGIAAVVAAAIVATIGSTQLSGDPMPRAGLVGPLLGVAAAAGALLAAYTPRSDAGLVIMLTAVTAVAAALRRFPPAGGSTGILLWLGAVVTATLHSQSNPPTWALASACVISGLWLGVLATTVFRPRPRTSLVISISGLLGACEDALDIERGAGRRRADVVRLDLLRTALVADAHLQRAAPADSELIREHLLIAHQRADQLCASSGHAEAWPVRCAMRSLQQAAQSVGLTTLPGTLEPAIRLARGSLPGAAGLAGQVPFEGRHARRSVGITTRETTQAGLAALCAALVSLPFSGSRITWSVLAAFTVLGAAHATPGTLFKGLGRMVGTALGVAVGLAVGVVLSVVPPVVVLVLAGGLAFWVQARHFTLSMTCATVAVSALYRGLGAPVADLLALRLVDTVVGAGCAIAVTLALWPLTGRSLTAAARRGFADKEREARQATNAECPALAAALVRLDAAGEAVIHADLRHRRNARAARPTLDRLAVGRALLDPTPSSDGGGQSHPHRKALSA